MIAGWLVKLGNGEYTLTPRGVEEVKGLITYAASKGTSVSQMTEWDDVKLSQVTVSKELRKHLAPLPVKRRAMQLRVLLAWAPAMEKHVFGTDIDSAAAKIEQLMTDHPGLTEADYIKMYDEWLIEKARS